MTPYIMKSVLVIVGIVLVVLTFIMYSAKKMTVHLAVTWEWIGFTGIVIGIVPIFSNWCFLLSRGTAAAVIVAGILIIWGGYQMSIIISLLLMRSQELTMQVSLLNQENERIMTELSNLTGKPKREL